MKLKQCAASLTLATIGFFVFMSLSASAAWAQTATDLKCKGCVSSKELKKNAVKGNRIKDNAVTGAKVKDDSIGTSDIADESLTGTDILNGSIGAADLGPGALGDAEDAVLYTRWGRSACPAGATTVYSGIVGGSNFAQSGSGSNLLCLSLTPNWDNFNDANQEGALIYGAEYETTGYGLAGVSPFNSLHDRDVPCAVCLREGADVMLMQPGRNLCPASFSLEYQGYLMAQHYTQASNEFVCVDRTAEATGSATNHNGALLYPTEAQCGSLPCGPGQYVQDRELTCSVCTR